MVANDNFLFLSYRSGSREDLGIVDAGALLQALGGGQADVAVEPGESPSAIIHFVVRDSGAQNLADRAAGLEVSALEDWLTVALRTWEDDWHQAVRDLPPAEDRARAALWSEGFSDAYRATYAADVGVRDALALEALGEQSFAVQGPDGSELYVLDFGLRAKEAGDGDCSNRLRAAVLLACPYRLVPDG